jgi:hypothetical protein
VEQGDGSPHDAEQQELTEPRVMPRHLKAAGFCFRGGRQKASLLGLDWQSFVKNGIPVSELANISDAQVQRIVEIVAQEESEKWGRVEG